MKRGLCLVRLIARFSLAIIDNLLPLVPAGTLGSNGFATATFISDIGDVQVSQLPSPY